MTIRSFDHFTENVWDWGILNGCFGSTRIAPTDLDGIVERNGQFLVVEAKNPKASIPKGQQYTFEALRSTGLFTIIIVWGEKSNPYYARVFTRLGRSQPFPCDQQLFRRLVGAWFHMADTRQPISLSQVLVGAGHDP